MWAHAEDGRSNADLATSALHRWNPLNTTRPSGAAGEWIYNWPWRVRGYPSAAVGEAATAATLLNGHYPVLVGALRGDWPVSQWAASRAVVGELGVWGTGSGWLCGG